jgi:8-oxo-dGTP pyrophosphatase MutT (NUDIX family)
VWSVVDDLPPLAHPVRITTDDVVVAVRAIAANRVGADFSGVRPSAVLVLVADDADGNAGVLLTRRSTALRNHAGQISFPGGRLDPGETEIAAALREAHEEVGLDPAAVEIIGELDHLSTIVSRSHIVPVVGRAVDQLSLGSASPEVERVMWVPLAEFVRVDTFRAERWSVPPGLGGAQESTGLGGAQDATGLGGTERVLYFFELEDETVWGATAHILVDLLTRLRSQGAEAIATPRPRGARASNSNRSRSAAPDGRRAPSV